MTKSNKKFYRCLACVVGRMDPKAGSSLRSNTFVGKENVALFHVKGLPPDSSRYYARYRESRLLALMTTP